MTANQLCVLNYLGLVNFMFILLKYSFYLSVMILVFQVPGRTVCALLRNKNEAYVDIDTAKHILV